MDHVVRYRIEFEVLNSSGKEIVTIEEGSVTMCHKKIEELYPNSELRELSLNFIRKSDLKKQLDLFEVSPNERI